jgi:hypothetical protein
MKNKKRICYVLYDERAELGNTEDASVLCTASTLEEAKSDKKEMFPNAVIYKNFIDEDNVCRRDERVW